MHTNHKRSLLPALLRCPHTADVSRGAAWQGKQVGWPAVRLAQRAQGWLAPARAARTMRATHLLDVVQVLGVDDERGVVKARLVLDDLVAAERTGAGTSVWIRLLQLLPLLASLLALTLMTSSRPGAG